ncbi:MAG: hypothetical protein II534_06400 [Clostridia bacterium]|nr:hypothetical protein [Clostridia bacterium]
MAEHTPKRGAGDGEKFPEIDEFIRHDEISRFEELGSAAEFGESGSEFHNYSELSETSPDPDSGKDSALSRLIRFAREKQQKRNRIVSLFAAAAGIAVTTVALLVTSVLVDIKDYSDDGGRFSVSFSISAPEDIGFYAVLNEEDGDYSESRVIDRSAPSVSFPSLRKNTVYDLTVFRDDSGEPVLVKNFLILEDTAPPGPAPETQPAGQDTTADPGGSSTVTPGTGEPPDVTGVPADSTENPEDTADVPDDTTETPEDSATVPDDTTEPPPETTAAPVPATVTESSDPRLLYNIIGVFLSADNPGGHILDISVSPAATVSPVTLGNGDTSVTLTGLTESTSYTVTVTDSDTGTVVFTKTYTTPAGPSATGSVTLSSADCFSIRQTLSLSNPAGHSLTLDIDGRKTTGSTLAELLPPGSSDNTLAMEGLQPATSHTVKLTDSVTGATVFSNTAKTSDPVTFEFNDRFELIWTLDDSWFAKYPACSVGVPGIWNDSSEYDCQSAVEYDASQSMYFAKTFTYPPESPIYGGQRKIRIFKAEKNENGYPEADLNSILCEFEADVPGFERFTLSAEHILTSPGATAANAVRVTVTSGSLPELNGTDVLKFVFINENDNYATVAEFEVGADGGTGVTLSGSTLTFDPADLSLAAATYFELWIEAERPSPYDPAYTDTVMMQFGEYRIG